MTTRPSILAAALHEQKRHWSRIVFTSLGRPILALALLFLAGHLHAQVPQLINYQGRIASGTVNFDGTGQFKFALVNGTGSVTFWSNNGSSTAGSEPTAAVALTVVKGLYSVALGDTALANMTAVPTTVFSNADVRLRVWFNDGVNGFQLLTPDQRIVAAGYAMLAAKVSDGPMNDPPSGVFPARGMVWIRPGGFLMGSRTDEPLRNANEGPQTMVTLTRGFWIGAHEVTQAEYVAVIGSNPSGFTGNTNRPVETVNWNAAVTYCTTLTNTERTAGRIPATWSYRLPREAEWEYCARAGARTTRYWFGDDLAFTALPSHAWFSGSTTQSVEQKLANPWGLADMGGNVWEWCQDFYASSLPGGNLTDPTGPVTGTERVLRGGSYFNLPERCRCAARTNGLPTSQDNASGFRVVLAPN